MEEVKKWRIMYRTRTHTEHKIIKGTFEQMIAYCKEFERLTKMATWYKEVIA